MSQVIALPIRWLMFLSPVFYPVSSVPGRWQPWLQANPLKPVVLEQLRSVALDGLWPDWPQLVLDIAITNAAARDEVRWFAAPRTGFADVL